MEYSIKQYQKKTFIIMGIIVAFYILINCSRLFSTGNNFSATVLMLLLQAGAFLLAISPIGESILRYLYGARALRTQQEMRAILPIFEEVYEDVLETFPEKTRRDIKLYIDDSGSIPHSV